MIDKRRVLTISGTLLLAFAVGHIMQGGGSARGSLDAGAIKPAGSESETDVKESALGKSLVPLLPVEILVPSLNLNTLPRVETRIAVLDHGFETELQSDIQTPKPFVLACDVELSATSKPGAMIDLQVKAPCHENMPFTIAHSGLEFSGIVDDRGRYQIQFPALAKESVVSASFADGSAAETQVRVDGLDGYVRAAAVWTGVRSLHIHALEFGAEFGENGHVWADDPRDPEFGVFAKGGFLTELGEDSVLDAKFAEVYSFPADRISRGGAIRLVVEAEITEQNCGQNLKGRTIEMDADGVISEIGLELPLLGCDAVGDFLVLKNLLQDLRIAQN